MWWGTVRCLLAASLNTPAKTNPALKSVRLSPAPAELPLSSRHKHLITCVDGWVGGCGWKGRRGGECCLAPCHVFQREENKSICEVATGAECTFAAGVCYVCSVPTCYCGCARVCVSRSRFGGWLAGFSGVWAVTGQLGWWAVLLPRLGYTQTWPETY